MEMVITQMSEEEEARRGQEQWGGAVEAALPGTPAGAAWAHVASFCSAHRYLPGIDVCERVSGADGGVEADYAARRLRYAVVASNMGFGRYAATLRVLADPDDDADQRDGCRISWEFECDAVRAEGWSEAALVGRLDASVKGMAERVRQAVRVGAPRQSGMDRLNA